MTAGRRPLLWGDIVAAQRAEAERTGEHVCLFPRTSLDTRCEVCGETIGSVFGVGSHAHAEAT